MFCITCSGYDIKIDFRLAKFSMIANSHPPPSAQPSTAIIIGLLILVISALCNKISSKVKVNK